MTTGRYWSAAGPCCREVLHLRASTIIQLDRPARPADPAVLVEAAADVSRQADARAEQLDHDGAFPGEDIAGLAAGGLLTAPLPRGFGGAGLGTTPEGALPLLEVLRRIGHGSLPLGRLYEGHVNALKLIFAYGSLAQQALFAAECRKGRLFGVWNTEGRDGLRLLRSGGGQILEGRKIFASGAGHVERPLVTARTESGDVVMVVPQLEPGHRADLSGWKAHGMRASATGAVDFTGIAVGDDEIIGDAGAYERQPLFSAGAWRFAAVQLGGIERVLDELRRHLLGCDRDADASQQARVGQGAIAAETAHLWLRTACERAEDAAADESAVAYVGLARLAVERAGLDVLELAQRGIGLQGFLRTHPVERIGRDLATYLRQPAPDRVLAESARHVLASPRSAFELWSAA